MNRFQRFLTKDFMYRFAEESGGGTTLNRRATDHITPEMIKKEANNGKTIKELLVEYHYENKIEIGKILTTQWWHTKIILVILVALVSGFVALIFFSIRNGMIGG